MCGIELGDNGFFQRIEVKSHLFEGFGCVTIEQFGEFLENTAGFLRSPEIGPEDVFDVLPGNGIESFLNTHVTHTIPGFKKGIGHGELLHKIPCDVTLLLQSSSQTCIVEDKPGDLFGYPETFPEPIGVHVDDSGNPLLFLLG